MSIGNRVDNLLNARANQTKPPSGIKTARAPKFRTWSGERPFVGAALMSIAGIEMFFSGQLDIGHIHVQVGIEGLQATIIPIALVLLGILILLMPQHRIFYGVIGLALALYSLVGDNLGGFFIGMLLAAVGGILAVSWIPKGAEPRQTEARDSELSGISEAGAASSVVAESATAEPRPLALRR
jgi:Family of unknown function (DUF6114)